jgi:hypothetical protein
VLSKVITPIKIISTGARDTTGQPQKKKKKKKRSDVKGRL